MATYKRMRLHTGGVNTCLALIEVTDDVRLPLEARSHWMRGNVDWSALSGRYHGGAQIADGRSGSGNREISSSSRGPRRSTVTPPGPNAKIG